VKWIGVAVGGVHPWFGLDDAAVAVVQLTGGSVNVGCEPDCICPQIQPVFFIDPGTSPYAYEYQQ
jgi:hypothetical protein